MAPRLATGALLRRAHHSIRRRPPWISREIAHAGDAADVAL